MSRLRHAEACSSPAPVVRKVLRDRVGRDRADVNGGGPAHGVFRALCGPVGAGAGHRECERQKSGRLNDSFLFHDFCVGFGRGILSFFSRKRQTVCIKDAHHPAMDRCPIPRVETVSASSPSYLNTAAAPRRRYAPQPLSPVAQSGSATGWPHAHSPKSPFKRANMCCTCANDHLPPRTVLVTTAYTGPLI